MQIHFCACTHTTQQSVGTCTRTTKEASLQPPSMHHSCSIYPDTHSKKAPHHWRHPIPSTGLMRPSVRKYLCWSPTYIFFLANPTLPITCCGDTAKSSQQPWWLLFTVPISNYPKTIFTQLFLPLFPSGWVGLDSKEKREQTRKHLSFCSLPCQM